MRTTLSYTSTKLNKASSSSPSQVSDPVTGLTISTGTNSGDFVELTAAQALALSNTTVGTLYEGVYQRVKLSSSASNPALGEALFFDEANDTTDPYVVINTPGSAGTAQYEWAGTVIDPATTPGQYCWIQVGAGKHSVRLTTAGAAGNAVLFPTSGGASYTAAGTTVTVNYVGEQIAAVASGTALTLITRPQTKY